MNSANEENVALGVDSVKTTYRAVKTPLGLTSNDWLLVAVIAAAMSTMFIFLRRAEIIKESAYGSFTFIGGVALVVALISLLMTCRVSRLINSLNLHDCRAIYYKEIYRCRLEEEIAEALKRREKFQETRRQLEPIMEKILRLKPIITEELGGEFKVDERIYETRIDYTLFGTDYYCYAGETAYAKMLENVVIVQERRKHIQELEARLASMG